MDPPYGARAVALSRCWGGLVGVGFMRRGLQAQVPWRRPHVDESDLVPRRHGWPASFAEGNSLGGGTHWRPGAAAYFGAGTRISHSHGLARRASIRSQELLDGFTEVAAVAAKPSLWPALERFLPDYPDIKVESFIDHGLTGRPTLPSTRKMADAPSRYGGHSRAELGQPGPTGVAAGLASKVPASGGRGSLAAAITHLSQRHATSGAFEAPGRGGPRRVTVRRRPHRAPAPRR